MALELKVSSVTALVISERANGRSMRAAEMTARSRAGSPTLKGVRCRW